MKQWMSRTARLLVGAPLNHMGVHNRKGGGAIVVHAGGGEQLTLQAAYDQGGYLLLHEGYARQKLVLSLSALTALEGLLRAFFDSLPEIEELEDEIGKRLYSMPGRSKQSLDCAGVLLAMLPVEVAKVATLSPASPDKIRIDWEFKMARERGAWIEIVPMSVVV